MAASIRDLDRRRVPRTTVAAHAPRGSSAGRSYRAPTGPSCPRHTARSRAHPREPGVHSWWHLWRRLAPVRNAYAAVPLWTYAISGRALWCAGMAVHLGPYRADDL